ncbi:hypothetical protein [Moorena producens]|uniref:hypothetical protein n=1 Tax=Moorena producens TaxID=1155739 RepID=UPI003C76FEF2
MRYIQFSCPDSRLPIPDSLFPIPDSLFPVPCSLFPVPCSLLPTPYSLLPFPYFHHRLTSSTAATVSLRASTPPNLMIKGAN